MAECKTTPEIDSKPDLTSIDNVLDLIIGAFTMMQQPANSIPPAIVFAGKNTRPGMSCRNLSARVISRLESDAGIPTGDIFADGDNSIPQLVDIISCEAVAMIQTEALVSVAVDPGSVQSVISGTAGIIPLAGTATNTVFFGAKGGIQ